MAEFFLLHLKTEFLLFWVTVKAWVSREKLVAMLQLGLQFGYL